MKSTISIKKAVLMVLLLASVRPAIAAETSSSADDNVALVFTAGEIVVMGKKDIARETVTAADMSEHDDKTVTKSVDIIPGVNMTNSGTRNEGMIYVRGFDMRQVPMYLDGVPMYVPYDGYVDPNRFMTFDLSQISISKGFSSVLYGPNTMGGAINLVTRKPESKFEGNINGGGSFADDAVSSKYGSVNIGSNQGAWYVEGGFSILDRSFFPLSDAFVPTSREDGKERNNSDSRDVKGSVKIGYTPNSTDEYTLSFSGQHANKGVPIYLGSDPSKKIWDWRWRDWDKSSLYYIGKTAVGEKSYIKSRAFFDDYYNTLEYYSDATYTTMTSLSLYDDKTAGGSVEFGTEALNGHIMKLALLEKYDMHNEWENPGTYTLADRDNTFSVAAEDTWKASRILSVIAGVRQDFHTTQRAEGYIYSGRAKTGVAPFPLENNQAANGQLAIAARPDDRQEVTAYIARTTRFPTLKDRYSYKNGTAQPNPYLKPEESWNYGIDYSIKPAPALRCYASVYQSRLNDVIQQVTNAVTIGDHRYNQMQNTGKATFTGFDLAADWMAAKWLKAYSAYSYINRKNDSNPSILFVDVPKNKLTGYLQFMRDKESWVMIEGEFNSKRYSNSSDARYSAGAYAVANIRLNAGLSKGLTMQLSVNNLFDRNYQISEGYPEAGREYFVSMNYAL